MKHLLFITAVTAAGCQMDSQRTLETSNKAAKVEVLFTDEDGYTVKRFRDAGELRYYVTPGPAEAIFTQSDGTDDDGNEHKHGLNIRTAK